MRSALLWRRNLCTVQVFLPVGRELKIGRPDAADAFGVHLRLQGLGVAKHHCSITHAPATLSGAGTAGDGIGASDGVAVDSAGAGVGGGEPGGIFLDVLADNATCYINGTRVYSGQKHLLRHQVRARE